MTAPVSKAQAIAEGLWEKATEKERAELAGMQETKLVEMAVMFGIGGEGRNAFAAAIGELSRQTATEAQS